MSQPLWAYCVLLPVNLVFSSLLGYLVGKVVAVYIRWRVRKKSEFLWVQLNKNPQMGGNTADLVLVLVVACYTLSALCEPRYIQYATGELAVFAACVTLHYSLESKSLVQVSPSLSLSLSLRLMFKVLFIYTVGILFHVECCIRQLWCSSIILYYQ